MSINPHILLILCIVAGSLIAIVAGNDAGSAIEIGLLK